LTIQENFGKDLSGRKFTYVGDGNNMAHTWLSMGAVLGAHVVVASPPGRWMPNAEIVNRAKVIAASTGASVEVTNDVKAACTDASVIYTDVWMSMGDSESDRQEKIAALKEYSVTSSLMKLGTKDALFMHCLPAHRGEEVSTEVIDGPQSVVWREAFHRRTTIQSALYHLLKGDIQGR
jgi:ornithine carbamoyltransferase